MPNDFERLVNAVIKQESNFNHKAVSPKGARGLGQVMPETGRNPGFGVRPLQNNDPSENVRFTADYLGAMMKKYNGRADLALAAYNAGAGAVDKHGGIPPYGETQGYVSKILSSLNPISSANANETPYKPTREEFIAQKMASYKPTREEFLAQKMAEYKPQEQPGILERAGKNLPRDLTNIGEGVINMAKHPIDTLDSLSGLPLGIAGNFLPESVTKNMPQEDIQRAANLGRGIKEAVKHPLETFAEKPASTILNTAGILSGVGGVVKGTIGKAAKASAQADVANVARQNALKQPTIDVLKEAQVKGYGIPQSEVAPKFWNNRLEGVAGKAALNQDFSLQNQQAISAQARKAIGVGDDVPITGTVIKDAIKSNFKPYEEIANMPTPRSPANGYSINSRTQVSSKDLLTELKQARKDSQKWYNTAEAQGGNPEIVARADALYSRAEAIETEFERRAEALGRPELVPQLRQARENIAKIYDVDKSRNVATGEIDPVVMGRKLDKAPDKITGELKQIGEFQQAFKKYAKPGESVQTPGISKVEAMMSVGTGSLGAAVGGPVGAFVGAMIPLVASNASRKLIMSKWYQSRLVDLAKSNPSKLKKFMSKATNKTLDERALLGLVASDKDNNKLEGLINER